jgi:cysteine-rich repeat protein
MQVASGAAPRDFTTDDWTVDLVVTIDANQSGLGSFLLFYASGDGTELYLGVEPDFALRVYHDAVPVGSVGATSPPGAVPTNVPVHIVMRRVGPTIDVYVDGQAVTGLDAVAGPSDPQKNTGDGFTLGALPSEQINDQAIAATYGLFRVSWDDLYGNSAKTVSSWSSFESCAATQCTYANFVDMSTQPTTTGGSYNAAITYSGGATVLHSGLLCDTCGNGQQDAFEECDDGNDDDGDACSNACTLNGVD